MTERTGSDYYLDSSNKILKRFNRYFLPMRQPVRKKYGRSTARVVEQDTRDIFKKLLAELPYVGGDEGGYTLQLMQSAYSLAFYRAIQKQGGNVDEAGMLLHKSYGRLFALFPRFLRQRMGKRAYTGQGVEEARQKAARSQERRYPEDWVCTFVEGDGSFDWGIDFSECGIKKFLEVQDALELGPYMCAVDYITIGAMGVELRRTKTLIHGCDCCDFRFVVDGTPPPAWPPRFPEKDCGRT
ncbi:MAG: L-2-amino-thiazoline-4-carboxylic acid hydrolase [Anaerolineae bacterium]|nr:L-2-amino-thiazoline-4-carboxylic acid hydrolase [Anaerolineae bacterium]